MSTEISPSIESQNEETIKKLYEALAQNDTVSVAKLIATEDLEYWFHGPPTCQHMMHVLTGGQCVGGTFRFEPRSVTAVGDASVIAEGWEGSQAYWVHVWTVGGGVVTSLREYFNTWLTVSDLRPDHRHMATLWRSMPRDLFRRSLPGLLLAI